MSPRAIRRAAEHKARKLAVKQNQLKNPGLTEASPTIIPPVQTAREGAAVCPSDFSLTPKPANLSTGPRTPEGKAISSLNALKTGLTGRTVLLSSDDAETYASHLEQYRAEYLPAGLRETELVQSLADTSWRLGRIPGLEMGIYALGRREFADSFGDHDPSLRHATVELHTFLKYEKQIRNLQLQESRLRRRYTAETKELRDLQKERAKREVQPPAAVPTRFEFSTVPSAPASAQFEFSSSATTCSAFGALLPPAPACHSQSRIALP